MAACKDTRFVLDKLVWMRAEGTASSVSCGSVAATTRLMSGAAR